MRIQAGISIFLFMLLKLFPPIKLLVHWIPRVSSGDFDRDTWAGHMMREPNKTLSESTDARPILQNMLCHFILYTRVTAPAHTRWATLAAEAGSDALENLRRTWLCWANLQERRLMLVKVGYVPP